MVNIKMVFYHPKYYKELRKLRNNSDQAISHANSTRGPSDVRPDPGLKPQAAGDKLQAIEETVPHNDIEEAAGVKLSNQPVQASGGKRQAPGSKLQASSHKLQAP